MCYVDGGGTRTLGCTVLTDRLNPLTPGLFAHEESPTTRWAELGNIAFAIHRSVGLGISQLNPKSREIGGGGCWNYLELTAAPGGGYQKCVG